MSPSIKVLSIGSERTSEAVRATLLSKHGFQLQFCSGCHDMLTSRDLETPEVIIVDGHIPAHEMRDGMEDARRRWPMSRILIIEDVLIDLPDHLYDERVSTAQLQDNFVPTTRRLAGKDPFRKEHKPSVKGAAVHGN